MELLLKRRVIGDLVHMRLFEPNQNNLLVRIQVDKLHLERKKETKNNKRMKTIV